ncbi:hypothetical protein B8X02_09155 [Stenotrophomonas rhizophila]|jgi:hypothetical protein|uniref:hypothetical protein n=1 Tax=Stenotrophomonas rhizophila TaxID=216778 RepID=UPI000BA60061|nr:hypothetical protein [Stenotrophomonas rhizophila]PAK92258.1 hypothetical protein B8X02_09155 [Stenotrophomonas rhizophila]UQY86640.1 hypothetical protein LQE85_14245 [Stenotrophomonas rhizophila]
MNDNHDLDSDLQSRLRALPSERLPPADAWQRIAAQLPPRVAALPAAAPAPRARRWSLRIGLGLAAALAVLVVVPTSTPPTPRPSPLQRQADVIAAEYQQAMATLPAAPIGADWQPALHELDTSAVYIRAAIAENPRSGYLLTQLQRTYALRLELTQQAVNAAGLPS